MLNDYQTRTLAERAELHSKIVALRDFLVVPTLESLAVGDKHLLHDQLTHMEAYLAVLDTVIDTFKS